MTRTALAAPDAHEHGARRALLERFATDLSVLASATEYTWTCCWLPYTGPHGQHWLWQMCGAQMPGGLPHAPDGRHVRCGHWHHQTDYLTFMATGG